MTRSFSMDLPAWLFVLAPVGLCASQCVAQEATPTTQWALQVGTGSSTYRATEYSAAGQRLNQESGNLRTQRIALGLNSDAEYFQIGYEQSRSSINYDGQTQTGIGLQTQTSLDLRRAYLEWRHPLTQGAASRWFSVLGAERMWMDRHIQGTPPAPPQRPLGTQPLRESMDVLLAYVGVVHRATAWPVSKLNIESSFQVRSCLKNRMSIDTFGTFDQAQLAPGHCTDWRLGIEGQYAIKPDWTLSLALRRESFTPKSSAVVAATKNGVPSASIQYPGSRQFMSQLSVGAAWSF